MVDSCLRQTNSSGVESERCVCESEYYESLHFRDFVFVSRDISVFFFFPSGTRNVSSVAETGSCDLTLETLRQVLVISYYK